MNIPTDKLSRLKSALATSVQQEVLRYHIMTFGCQMNHADSEKVQMLLAQSGLLLVDDWKDADIVIFNTCSVRQKGEDRVFGFLHEVDKYNKQQNTRIRTILTGCMARKTGINKGHYDYQGRKNTRTITRVVTDTQSQIETDTLFNSDDELFGRVDTLDAVFRIEEVGALTTILSLLFGREIGQDDSFHSYLQVGQKRDTSGSANVIIQTGCDNYCTFCIVPFTRGHEISRPQDEIVIEVQQVVKDGAKEVTLLGQNVNSYGKQGRTSLWNADELTWKSTDVRTPFRELLERLDAIDGLERIRFTSSNPHDMTRDILDGYRDLPSVSPYLHFALQSGSDDILKKMSRRHTYGDFRTMVQYLRKENPYFGISTDIIVGFPGETDEDFDMTVTAFRECDFDFAYIARYSPRNQTYASKMKNMVDHETKAHRWDILNQELQASIYRRNQMMIDREDEILVTNISEKHISGRTKNFKEVFVPYRENIQLGDLIQIRITQLDNWVLRGDYL